MLILSIASQGPVEGFQMEDQKSIWWLFCHTDNGSKSLWLYTTYSLYHQSSDATTSFNASLLTTYQWKSGCPVDVRHRCHIRLFGSTNLVDLMTSGIGKYTLCVLHTPVVMPLKPAKAPCTCKVYRTIDGQAWKYSILSWGSEEKWCLTAFWPSTVHRMASDALARTARSMYVGSIYLTSEWTPISLKWDLICGMAWLVIYGSSTVHSSRLKPLPQCFTPKTMAEDYNRLTFCWRWTPMSPRTILPDASVAFDFWRYSWKFITALVPAQFLQSKHKSIVKATKKILVWEVHKKWGF